MFLGCAQSEDLAALVWEACKRLCAWNTRSQPAVRLARSQLSQRPCAWEADPAALGRSLSGGRAALGQNHAALGSEVLGLWVEQLDSAPDALGGFRCVPPVR